MKKLRFLAGLFSILILCGFVFTTCDMEGSTPEIVDAVEPVFDELPPLYNEKVPNAYVEWDILATVTDGGSVTYQWYMLPAEYITLDGEPAEGDGADTNSFRSTNLTEGIYYFYVVATNTNSNATGVKTASARSSLITVVVIDPNDPVKYPEITEQPGDRRSVAGNIDMSVTAKETEEGELSYQWYSASTPSNTGGDIINGATADTYTANLTAGTYYFYVVVTNSITTPGDDPDNPTISSKSINSQPVTVEVVADLNPNATITLNANRKYQYVRGFGGMDIPWSTFWSITEEEYEKMYNPVTGLGFNMIRIMIMPENPDDNTDPEKTIDYYLGEGGRPNYIKGVQIVNRYNGYVLASPWSPPPEWKTNNDKNGGGILRPTYYVQYANYLKRFCEVMLERGAPIYAVSIQNEPNFTASYDGCEWTGAEMRDFFKTQGVGRFTEGVSGWGNGVQIPRVLIMNGESANHPNVNDEALDDPASRDLIDVIGRHTYGNVQVRYGKALDLGKEVWMTEHNINSGNVIQYPNDSTWNYVWAFMNDVDVSIRLNDESAFIWWALKRFYSFIGEGQYGTVEGVILPRGYALSHYAKFAKETWRIGVGAQGTTANGTLINMGANFNNNTFDRNSVAAKATAFVSDDGNEISVVMYTPTSVTGGGGLDMGTVRIQLPSGFIASSATAIRSSAAVKAKQEDVLLADDKNSAFIMLPPGNIVSVRFTK